MLGFWNSWVAFFMVLCRLPGLSAFFSCCQFVCRVARRLPSPFLFALSLGTWESKLGGTCVNGESIGAAGGGGWSSLYKLRAGGRREPGCAGIDEHPSDQLAAGFGVYLSTLLSLCSSALQQGGEQGSSLRAFCGLLSDRGETPGGAQMWHFTSVHLCLLLVD